MMTRIKQDRSRRSGHKHSLNTQDYPIDSLPHPPGYWTATRRQRIAYRKAMKCRHLAALIDDGHPLMMEAKRSLLKASVALEHESGLT